MTKRKQLVATVLVPIITGAVGLINLMNQPKFENIPTVAVVQLTGSGVCFGVALCALFAIFRTKRQA